MSHYNQFNTKSFFAGVCGITLLRGVVPTLAGIVFVIYVSYLGWMSLAPQKPLPDPERKRLANVAVTKIISQLKNGRKNIRHTILLHFENDPSDYFTNQLRSQLDATGILNLEDRSFLEKLRNKLHLRNVGCTSLAEALNSTKNSDAQGVLWGTLSHFETSESGTVVKGKWQLVEIKTGEIVCAADIDEDTSSPAKIELAKNINALKESIYNNTSFISQTSEMIPWYIRFLGFVLLVLLLPIMTIVFIRTMVAKRSNKINAFILSIYTIIDAIFAFFMVGGRFYSGTSVILFLVATGLAFTYNCILMNFALKLES